MKTSRTYCGIDVSAETLDCCFADSAGKFQQFQVENTKKGYVFLLKKCAENPHFVFEATGVYHLRLMFHLHQNERAYSVVNALQIKRYIQMQLERNKSDKKDAKRICEYGMERQPKVSEMPDNQYFECKSLNNAIETITKGITAFTNQIHSLKKLPIGHKTVMKSYEKIIKSLQQELKDLEVALQTKLAEWQPELVELVSSVTSIGKRATSELIVYTQGFKNMENYRQLISYSGLSPKEFSSGSSIRGKSKICKQGGKTIRHILYMCSMNAIKNNPPCKAFHAGNFTSVWWLKERTKKCV